MMCGCDMQAAAAPDAHTLMLRGSVCEWKHWQPVWGVVHRKNNPETYSFGLVAGVLVYVGGVTGWDVEWLHPTRFRGPNGYADPSIELRLAPFDYSFNSLVERFPGEADEFLGTPSVMKQIIMLQLVIPRYLDHDIFMEVVSYLRPLPGLQMAQQHYEDFVLNRVSPDDTTTRVEVLTHRHFRGYYEWYLVRRWRILIACNGKDALGFVDVDRDMAMVREHYASQYNWLHWAIRYHEHRGIFDIIRLALETNDNDERWLR